MNLEDFDIKSVNKDELQFELVDKWIFSKLNKTIIDVNKKLENFVLDEAAKSVYEFLRGDFCDWYVEMAKPRLYGNEDEKIKKTAQYVLWTILENGLRLLHPFMPYLTEEIWQKLGVEGETIMLQPFPILDEANLDDATEKKMEYLQGVISAIRNIRAEMNLSPAKEVNAVIRSKDQEELQTIEVNKNFLMKLAKLENVEYGDNLKKPSGAGFRVAENSEVYIPLEGLLDIEAECKKIKDQIGKLEKELQKVNGKLSSEKFISKAPAHIVEREKKIQKEYMDKLEKLQDNLKAFSK
jgi:valyl-tRNA synthetase